MLANPHGRKLMRQFEEAVRAHEFMGGSPPEDHDRLERDYKKTRQALQDYLDGSKAA